MRVIILSLLILNCIQVQAIKVGKGRISLYDLDSAIISKPRIAQDEFINVYPLSSNIDENKKTVIAIQGLVANGHTNIFVETQKGIQNINVELDQNSSEIFSKTNTIKTIKANIKINLNSSILIKTNYHINEKILASNPDFFKINSLTDYYHPQYMKSIILIAEKQASISDIVIPTSNKIFKFTLSSNNYKGQYNETLNLN
jgi:hypothetical protein